MRKRGTLVQLMVMLLFVLIIVGFIPGRNILSTKAQSVVTSPTFNCLGPCASGSPSGGASGSPSSSPSTGASPSTSTSTAPASSTAPCGHGSFSSQLAHRGDNGRGGFLSQIFQFFFLLFQILGQLIGGGDLSGMGSGSGSGSSSSVSSAPVSGSVAPSVGVSPCVSSSSSSSSSTSTASSSVTASSSATASGSATTEGLGLTDPNKCTEQGAGAGIRTSIPKPKCTINAADVAAAGAAKSGDVVCFTGNLTARLTADKPGVTYFGGGTVTVPGIDVTGEGTTVQGFVIQGANAPGIMASGKNITVVDNKVVGPTKGGDNDGMRFFGDGLKIVHNTISNIQPEGGAHADCMQTYATGADSPATSNTIVDSNRCEQIANICWIIEGPNSTAGDGSHQGTDSNDLFINNYCNGNASDGVFTDDVHGFKFINNDMEGNNNAAITFTGSQGDNVAKCTKMGGGTKQEVNIDAPRGG